MKNRLWMSLALVAALMLPAAAQTTSSSDSSSKPSAAQSTPSDQQAPAAQPATTDQNANATSQGAHQPLTMEKHEGFWGKLNPFARKKYVQRQLSPVRDRVNELDELTASNSKMIKDVDSRAQEGIRVASLKANEADQHAIDAGNRAQQANQTAQQATNRLQTVEKVVGNIDQYQATTQTEIRFRPGQSVLSKRAKDALDDMATPLKNQRGYIIEVQGFSSGHGQAAIANSQKMAESVVRYLVLNHDIPVYRIYLLGMGNAPMQAAEGQKARRTNGGRVEISLLKNDLEQLTANTGSTSMPADQGQAVSGATATPAQPATTAPNSTGTTAPQSNQPPQQ
jgi:outer membrane protein OmpA-like peptidoglycan-associated protein